MGGPKYSSGGLVRWREERAMELLRLLGVRRRSAGCHKVQPIV